MPEYQGLLDRQIDLLNARLQEKDLRIALGEALRERIISTSMGSHFGGRGMKRVFQDLVVDTVTDKLIEADNWVGAWLLDYDQFEVLRFEEDTRQHRFLPPAK